jgi:hypothetical protein
LNSQQLLLKFWICCLETGRDAYHHDVNFISLQGLLNSRDNISVLKHRSFNLLDSKLDMNLLCCLFQSCLQRLDITIFCVKKADI